MEKLQITKDKIAQKYGFEAWDLFEFSRTPGLNIDALIDETITEYSSELLRQNREMKEALENTLDELYRLGEHCADQNFIDFEDESIDGVNSYNRIMKQGRDCLTSLNKGKE